MTPKYRDEKNIYAFIKKKNKMRQRICIYTLKSVYER